MASGRVEVMFGHRVSTDAGSGVGPDARNTVRPDAFGLWLDARSDWRPLRCADLYARSLPERGFLLTLDDGYRDNLTEALPVIEKHGVPVLIFVTTGFVDGAAEPVEDVVARLVETAEVLRAPGGRELACADRTAKREVYERVRRQLKACSVERRDRLLAEMLRLNGAEPPGPSRRFLSWDEVRELDRHPLVTIGAHSHTHPLLTRASWREAEREIRESRERLERHLGHPVDAFAYPYGGHDWRVRRLVARNGFRLAFTTEPRALRRAPLRHPHRIPRCDLARAVAREAS